MVQDEDLDWAEDLESGDSIADAVSAAFRRGIARWQRLGLRPEHVVTRWEDGLLTMIVDIGLCARISLARVSSSAGIPRANG